MANVVQVIIRARDTSSRVLRGVQKQLGSLRAVARRVGGAFRAVGESVVRMGVAVGVAIFGLTRLASRGRDVIEVQRAFVRAAGNQEAALGKLRAATSGLVSDFELMQQFNQAIALGAADSVDQFAEMATTAQALGRALGIDTAFALQSLNTGIARQSRLFLDNIGIIVSVEQANEAYAAALGKTVSELTLAERREAFRTAAMEAARAKVKELGGVTITGADATTRFTTELKNAVDELGRLVATAPEVARFFDAMTRGIELVTGKLPEMIDFLGKIPDAVRAAFDAFSISANPAINALNVGRAVGQAFRTGDIERFEDRIARELAEPVPGAATPRRAAPITPATPPAEPPAPDLFDPRLRAGLLLARGGPGTSLGAVGSSDAFLARERARGIVGRAAMAGGAEGLAPFEQKELRRARDELGVTDEAFQQMIDSLSVGSEQISRAGQVTVASFGAMAQAAIQGGEITAQSITSMIGNILQSLPGVGGFLGSAIGAVTGIAGALFGGRDDPVPVRVTDFDPEAEQKLEPRRQGPDSVQVFINGQLITDARAARAEIRRAERRDAVTRIPQAG